MGKLGELAKEMEGDVAPPFKFSQERWHGMVRAFYDLGIVEERILDELRRIYANIRNGIDPKEALPENLPVPPIAQGTGGGKASFTPLPQDKEPRQPELGLEFNNREF